MDRKPKAKSRGRKAEFRLPRAQLTVPFELSIADESGTRFQAKLRSRDLSVSGAFLESSYFLPIGTRLEVCFQLDDDAAPLCAVAEIVRHEDEGRDGPGGFALRFMEFKGDARVAITELVLGESLNEFAQRYLKSKRAGAFASEAEGIVDLLASWELFKATGR
ncbi:MAG TPA: PilZ domain-containing protein [Myxococcales bacterium]|jgi:hypothetical protein